jgi:uncharacterized protein YjiK
MNSKTRFARSLSFVAAGLGVVVALGQSVRADEPYKVLQTTQTMGTGGIDYVYADNDGRKLYVPRGNQVLVFDLDTLKAAGSITNSGGHGVAVDPATHHGFASKSPVTMFDSQTLEKIKDVQTEGRPDGIFFEPGSQKIYVLSHSAPNVTVLDPKDGSIVGTIDLGGAPEQGASDGAGHAYIDLEDENQIAVVDTKAMKCTGHYSLEGKGGGPAGLGFDVKNHLLFAMCHDPATCVVLSSDDGKILAALPIGKGTDSGGFNPATMEAFSSQGDGTLTIIKETSPTTFEVEQNVTTKPRAKTCTLDTKNNHIILIAVEPVPGQQPKPADAGTPPPANGGRNRRNGPGLLDVIVVGR